MPKRLTKEVSHGWAPQAGPQTALVNCPIPVIFYGGARGGGKTDGCLGMAGMLAQRHGIAFNGLFVRKELPMLDDAIERSHVIFGGTGGLYNKVEKQWRWPSGARIRFRPLESVSDADKYQGQNLSHLFGEEAGQYALPDALDRLQGTLRSAYGIIPQLIMTGNPGGAGQGWIKSRYIDPYPEGMKVMERVVGDSGRTQKFVFIPSKVRDNKILLDNDPDYINKLHFVGSKELVRAWLDGDWNAVEGAYFDCFSTERHVIEPFEVPNYWTRFRSMDWGSAAPFSVGWWAIAGEDYDASGTFVPKGSMVRYREWYGAKSPGVGLKLPADEVARGIKARERGDVIDYGVLDPSAFAQDGGPSIAERMWSQGVHFRRADNRRVGKRGAFGGWDEMRNRLMGDKDGHPTMFFFSTCKDSIRTLPALQHDQSKPEDLDTTAEDHAADEIRYACMSRPYGKSNLKIGVQVKEHLATLKDLFKMERKHKSMNNRI